MKVTQETTKQGNHAQTVSGYTGQWSEFTYPDLDDHCANFHTVFCRGKEFEVRITEHSIHLNNYQATAHEVSILFDADSIDRIVDLLQQAKADHIKQFHNWYVYRDMETDRFIALKFGTAKANHEVISSFGITKDQAERDAKMANNCASLENEEEGKGRDSRKANLSNG